MARFFGENMNLEQAVQFLIQAGCQVMPSTSKYYEACNIHIPLSVDGCFSNAINYILSNKGYRYLANCRNYGPILDKDLIYVAMNVEKIIKLKAFW